MGQLNNCDRFEYMPEAGLSADDFRIFLTIRRSAAMRPIAKLLCVVLSRTRAAVETWVERPVASLALCVCVSVCLSVCPL